MPYFDHNATTPLSPAAREAWLQTADESWQNPSSLYRSAARARNVLDNKRAALAEILDVAPARIVFNSGATEGVNSTFHHFASTLSSDSRLLVSPVEHPCGLAAAERFFAGRLGSAPLDPEARVQPEEIGRALQERRPALVSIMAANNETGIIQPWRDIAAVARQAGVPYHCDASQWMGKMPGRGLGDCSLVTASAHKFGGPKGIGFLLVPEGAQIRGHSGGEQERGMRGGTEDLPAIAAMVAALQEAEAKLQAAGEQEKRVTWRDRFEREILLQIAGAKVVGQDVERLWNTVMLVLPAGSNERWVRKLDRRGFDTSTGSACATGKEAPSHVLRAMKFSPDEARRAVRVSSGWETSEEDWRELTKAMLSVFAEIGENPDAGSGLTEVVQV